MVETSGGDLEKKGVLRDDVDYSGAAKKSSPEEIALVRKLDIRIMPTLWCMYFLNYVRLLDIFEAEKTRKRK